MFKSEEHKLDKLEELLNIEKFAKNLDLNSKTISNGFNKYCLRIKKCIKIKIKMT